MQNVFTHKTNLIYVIWLLIEAESCWYWKMLSSFSKMNVIEMLILLKIPVTELGILQFMKVSSFPVICTKWNALNSLLRTKLAAEYYLVELHHYNSNSSGTVNFRTIAKCDLPFHTAWLLPQTLSGGGQEIAAFLGADVRVSGGRMWWELRWRKGCIEGSEREVMGGNLRSGGSGWGGTKSPRSRLQQIIQ